MLEELLSLTKKFTRQQKMQQGNMRLLLDPDGSGAVVISGGGPHQWTPIVSWDYPEQGIRNLKELTRHVE